MTRHTKNRNITLLAQYKQIIKFDVGQYRVLIPHMRGLSSILRKRERKNICINKGHVSDTKFSAIPIL